MTGSCCVGIPGTKGRMDRRGFGTRKRTQFNLRLVFISHWSFTGLVLDVESNFSPGILCMSLKQTRFSKIRSLFCLFYGSDVAPV